MAAHSSSSLANVRTHSVPTNGSPLRAAFPSPNPPSAGPMGLLSPLSVPGFHGMQSRGVPPESSASNVHHESATSRRRSSSNGVQPHGVVPPSSAPAALSSFRVPNLGGTQRSSVRPSGRPRGNTVTGGAISLPLFRPGGSGMPFNPHGPPIPSMSPNHQWGRQQEFPMEDGGRLCTCGKRQAHPDAGDVCVACFLSWPAEPNTLFLCPKERNGNLSIYRWISDEPYPCGCNMVDVCGTCGENHHRRPCLLKSDELQGPVRDEMQLALEHHLAHPDHQMLETFHAYHRSIQQHNPVDGFAPPRSAFGTSWCPSLPQRNMGPSAFSRASHGPSADGCIPPYVFDAGNRALKSEV